MIFRFVPLVLLFLAPLGCSQVRAISVTTNQEFIEQLRSEPLNLEDSESMFNLIFSSLPDSVTVYPTENYYYFKLLSNHREIWGNLRLDTEDRDNGIVHFAYFEVHGQSDAYFNNSKSWYRKLSIENGVELNKISDLVYSLKFNGKTVRFILNDLKQEIAGSVVLLPEEEFISRNCDESGFQFFLIFDKRLKSFKFILDESVALPDLLQPFGKDVWVGLRSGFAFHQEAALNRKLLFGVNERNVEVNNYFDGPFDQLGDNFVDPKKFEGFVVQAFPFYEGKVKGRGHFISETGEGTGSRVLISPYMSYVSMRELWNRIVECQEHLGETSPNLMGCVARDPKDPAYQELTYPRKSPKKPK